MPAAAEVAASGIGRASSLRIDTSSRDDVISAYQEWLAPTLTVPADWTGSVADCAAGSVSAAERKATLAAVNYMRAMAGLPPVTLNATFSARAQAAALIMAANRFLTHYPPPRSTCFTKAGSLGAHNGLLFIGWGGGPMDAPTGARAVVGYMSDPGEGNEPVGHRRWLLYQGLTRIGTGDTDISNSIYVVDGRPHPPGDRWVHWPTAGYFPRELEPRGRWSLTYPAANFDRAKVTVTSPDGRLKVRKHPPRYGFADNSLSWQVDLPESYQSGESDYPVTVRVTGIRMPDGRPATRTWTTTLVRAARP